MSAPQRFRYSVNLNLVGCLLWTLLLCVCIVLVGLAVRFVA